MSEGVNEDRMAVKSDVRRPGSAVTSDAGPPSMGRADRTRGLAAPEQADFTIVFTYTGHPILGIAVLATQCISSCNYVTLSDRCT
jgi:hypothetical protein